jgi:hypothetical protein
VTNTDRDQHRSRPTPIVTNAGATKSGVTKAVVTKAGRDQGRRSRPQPVVTVNVPF